MPQVTDRSVRDTDNTHMDIHVFLNRKRLVVLRPTDANTIAVSCKQFQGVSSFPNIW